LNNIGSRKPTNSEKNFSVSFLLPQIQIMRVNADNFDSHCVNSILASALQVKVELIYPLVVYVTMLYDVQLLSFK
jgi:hypothetical protein